MEEVRRRVGNETGDDGSCISSSTATKSSSSAPSKLDAESKIDKDSAASGGHFFSDRPVHIAQDSLLSSSSGYTNYRGFFNLAVILLVLSNSRVALENLIKYGILIDAGYWIPSSPTIIYKSPVGILLILLNVFIYNALFIEKSLYDGRIDTNRRGAFYHSINLTAVLIFPALVILITEPNPLGATICLSLYTTTFLKLISYAHVNYWCRCGRNKKTTPTKENIQSGSQLRSYSSETTSIVYPANLTVSNIYYFMIAPTLCYELNFPKSAKVRKWFVVKRLVESFILMQVIIALCQQWIVPLLKNSLEPFIAMNYSRMLERLLKLAIPNHIIWLIFFYWQFHSLLNLISELVRFADREFYRDWWNSETIDYFWRNWNIPVHRWCVRHMYKPMVKSGYNRTVSTLTVFLVSAFFHEYLISVPLRIFRLWAFCGMLGQLPLNMVTSRWAHGKAGNVVVWLSLIVGQPLCILMYVHDWYVTYQLPVQQQHEQVPE